MAQSSSSTPTNCEDEADSCGGGRVPPPLEPPGRSTQGEPHSTRGTCTVKPHRTVGTITHAFLLLVILLWQATPTGTLSAQSRPVAVAATPTVILTPDAAYPLTMVMAGTVAGDGSVLVLDELGQQVLRFAAEGHFLNRIGRPGQGPGEFAYPVSMQMLSSDSLMVFDSGNRRVTIFSLHGSVLDQHSILTPFAGGVLHRVPGGRSFLTEAPGMGRNSSGGVYRDTIGVFLMEPGFVEPRRLTLVPHVMSSPLTVEGRSFLRYAPFTPWTQARIGGRCLYISTGLEGEVNAWSTDGEIILSVTIPSTPERLDAALRGAYIAREMRRFPQEEQAAFARGARATLVFPDALPLGADLHVDPAGYVWVQKYEPLVISREWFVFDPDGGSLTTIVLPEGLHVLEIGEDYVLGVVYDALDVPSIGLYPLSRESSSPPASPCVAPGLAVR